MVSLLVAILETSLDAFPAFDSPVGDDVDEEVVVVEVVVVVVVVVVASLEDELCLVGALAASFAAAAWRAALRLAFETGIKSSKDSARTESGAAEF